MKMGQGMEVTGSNAIIKNRQSEQNAESVVLICTEG
jgi:hypothetical protein